MITLHNKSAPGDSLYTAASFFIFVLFAFLAINHGFFFTMDGDEAYNSTTAKNWLAGYGYSSSIGVIFPFDPYISSGPAYTLLLTLPLQLFGINPDIPKPFMATVHIALLGSAFWLIRQQVTSGRQFFWITTCCLSLFCITEFKFWHRSAGELLSLLYFVNAALLMARACSTLSLRYGVAGGLLAAMALLTKQQALLLLAGLLAASIIALGIQIFVEKNRKHKTIDYCVFILVVSVAFLVPYTAWDHYKTQSLALLEHNNPHLYAYYLGKDWHFFSTHGSGVNLLWETHSLHDFLKREVSIMLQAFRKLSETFSRLGTYNVIGGAGVILFSMVALVLSFRDLLKDSNSNLLFLTLPATAFLLWALLLNNSIFMHQMLPGVWLIFFTVAIACARYPAFLALLSTCALVITFATANKFGESACYDPNNAVCIYRNENPLRTSFRKTMNYLQTHKLPAPMANCGWYFAQDIEFSLPDVNNIQDCMRLFDTALAFDKDAFITANKLPDDYHQTKSSEEMQFLFVNKRKNLFGASFVAPVIWKKPLEFTYIASVHMMGDSLEHKRNVISFLDHCQETLFDDHFYVIKYCRYNDLQNYVNAWHGLPIFTHQWESVYYRDFMQQTKP